MSGFLPSNEEIRLGLKEGRPDLYRSLVENGTIESILRSLSAQAQETAVRAIEDGFAPDQAMELARQVYQPLMRG
jgi:hypothetical protein